MQTKRARRATKHEHTHRHDKLVETPLQKVLVRLEQQLAQVNGLMQASPENNAFRIGVHLDQANILLAEAQVMATYRYSK